MTNHPISHHRHIPPVFLVLLFFLWCSGSAHAALTVRVGSIDAHPGDQISVDVTVDGYDQENIAAAAFTLTYSSAQLTLTAVDSDFFDTFSNQWNSLTPTPDPLPPTTVSIDNQTVSSPVVAHTQIESSVATTMIVGARVTAGTPATLFTLHFTVNAAAAPDIYPISISPNLINNTSAGYDEAGFLLPVLYDSIAGETDLSAAFPGLTPVIVGGSINIEMPFIDEDGDGIYDKWERDHWGNLTTADETTDFDGDGYSDLQEYLNSYYPVETDPQGNIYDPVLIVNAPGGTGYNPTDKKGFWLLMLPAILSGGQQ